MFYNFSQNNSGGSFVSDGDVAGYVIIEAESAADANDKAESVGIYFNGCDLGYDCDCCGDRWYSASEYDKANAPEIFGKTLDKYVEDILSGKDSWGFLKGVVVYFANGDKLNVDFKGVRKEKTVKAEWKLNGKKVNLDKVLDKLTDPNPKKNPNPATPKSRKRKTKKAR